MQSSACSVLGPALQKIQFRLSVIDQIIRLSVSLTDFLNTKNEIALWLQYFHEFNLINNLKTVDCIFSVSTKYLYYALVVISVIKLVDQKKFGLPVSWKVVGLMVFGLN